MAHERLFTLLERLGNLTQAALRSAGQVHGLQPVPLLVLSFLAKANRYSNTPAAVADYLGLSRAATSQTLTLLQERGLIERTQDDTDRRVWRLGLTRAGRALAGAALPPASWSALHEAMGAGELERLEADLERLLQRLQQSDGALSFGVCQTCRHFLREGEDRFRCGLTQEPLPVAQTLRICREHADVEH
ncbi:MAG: MarR family winged helix-turn-helix transcriptional regulator [Betaproteobacteria bacterium]|jgi:DNA-binding MarR family transcriptional regulator